MLSSVQDALTRFHHSLPHRQQDQLYPRAKAIYGSKAQYATADNNSPLLLLAGKNFIQEVTGTFLYYARAINTTILPALGSITTQQAAPTENTMNLVKTIIDYAATHPDTIITYCSSHMVLSAHRDASYLSESKARSRAGGHFFMSNDSCIPANNGAVVTISQTIKAVMSSAEEA